MTENKIIVYVEGSWMKKIYERCLRGRPGQVQESHLAAPPMLQLATSHSPFSVHSEVQTSRLLALTNETPCLSPKQLPLRQDGACQAWGETGPLIRPRPASLVALRDLPSLRHLGWGRPVECGSTASQGVGGASPDTRPQSLGSWLPSRQD